MVTIVFFVSNGWLEIPLLRRLQKAIVECCRRCSPSVRSTTGSAKAASALSHSGDNNNNAIFEEDSMNVFGQMESLQFTDAQRRSVSQSLNHLTSPYTHTSSFLLYCYMSVLVLTYSYSCHHADYSTNC